MTPSLSSKVDSFFFSPTSPYPLGLCRLFFCGWLFVWFFNYDFVAIAHHPQVLWRPLLLLRILGIDEIPSAASLQLAQSIFKISLLTACLGLFTRTSLVVACLLGTCLLALTHSFSKVNHSDAGLVLALGILSLSRCGDVCSLDRFLRRKLLRREKDLSPLDPNGEYCWPMRLVQIILVTVMFAAGISKLLSGSGWIFSDNLYRLLVYCQVSRETIWQLDLSMPGLRTICMLAALGTVVVELLAPLALFVPRLRAALILGLLSMQLGILLLMGDNFTQFMALYLFWLPWTRILDVLAVRFGIPEMKSWEWNKEQVNPAEGPVSAPEQRGERQP